MIERVDALPTRGRDEPAPCSVTMEPPGRLTGRRSSAAVVRGIERRSGRWTILRYQSSAGRWAAPGLNTSLRLRTARAMSAKRSRRCGSAPALLDPARFPIADAHYRWASPPARMVGEPRYRAGAVHLPRGARPDTRPGSERDGWATRRLGTRQDHRARNAAHSRPSRYVYEAAGTSTRSTATSVAAGDAIDRAARTRRLPATNPRHSDLRAARAASYTPSPQDGGGVVMPARTERSLLMQAGVDFSEAAYVEAADRNLNFRPPTRRTPDGSWCYSVDGSGTSSHFHTCFVLKALARSRRSRERPRCTEAIERGSPITSVTCSTSSACRGHSPGRLA